jgi:hypothetical protein
MVCCRIAKFVLKFYLVGYFTRGFVGTIALLLSPGTVTSLSEGGTLAVDEQTFPNR